MKTNILAEAKTSTTLFSPMRISEKRHGHIRALGLEFNNRGNLWHPRTRQVTEFFHTRTGQDILVIIGYQSATKTGFGYETIDIETDDRPRFGKGVSVHDALPILFPADQLRLAQWGLVNPPVLEVVPEDEAETETETK